MIGTAIKFTIPWEPKSLQKSGKRMKIIPMGGKLIPRFFKTAKAEEYGNVIHMLSRDHAPAKPFDGPVELEIVFVLPRPKGLAKTTPGLLRHWKRPDYDNLTKGTQDALSRSGFWHDDGQISDAIIRKRVAEVGGKSRIEVSIREVMVDANILRVEITNCAASEPLQRAAKPLPKPKRPDGPKKPF